MGDGFNLIDAPWIMALDRSGRTAEFSIREALCGAEDLVSIGGDIPTQQFAITRVLLAIVRRAVDWGSNPVERWGQLWESGQLPSADIDAYLDSVRPRFNLVDADAPFFQVTDFQTAKDSVKPIDVLVSDVPASNRYFTTRAGSGAVDLSLAEAARWIVHTQAYDASGIKTGDQRDPLTKGGKGYPIGIAWAGQLGGVLLEGDTLAQTLLLNTVLVADSTSTLVDDDLPVWERPHLDVLVRNDPSPSGPLDLLTWQSRRVFVTYSAGRATGAVVGNGDPIEPFNRFRHEFLSGWRFSEIQSKKFNEDRYFPRTFDPDRAVWRGFESMLVDVTEESAGPRRGYTPAVVKWLDHLLAGEIIEPDTMVSAHIFGLRYDSKASVIGAAIDDRISMRVAAFGLVELRDEAINAVRTAESVARSVGALATDLALAAGGEGVGERASALTAFLAAVDVPYRGWLTRLGDSPLDDLRVQWHTTLYRLAGGHGRALIDQAGRPAFVGRTVANSKGKERWVDAAVAQQVFISSLRRELPGAFLDEPAEGDHDSAK